MLSGELVGRSALSGEIQREVISVGGSGGGDAPIKTISVDGVEVKPDSKKNVNINLSGKVDKDASETALPQVYAKDKNGTQTMLNAVQYYSDDRNGLARFINGNLIVNTPTEGAHATHKKYVDENFVPKVSTTGGSRVYAIGTDGSQKTINYNFYTPLSNWIAGWNSDKNLVTEEPVTDKACANKKYVDNLFNGANKAVSFINYSSMISSLNALSNNNYNVGQNIMIVTLQVPDLWVSEIAETSVAYTYVSDDEFIDELMLNGYVQVGYYKLSPLETQKVDLTEYAKLTQLDTKVSQVEYSKDQTFADGSDAGIIGRLYMRFRDNTENSIVANCQNARYTVPVRDSTGNFYVGNPTQLYHTMNLISVTAKQGTEAPTEDTKALYVGQLYYDTTNNKMYMCFGIDTTNKKYTWTQIIRATDIAGNSVKGVVDVRAAFGLQTDQYGRIQTVKATDDEITAKTNEYHPIVPKNLDFAIVQALTNNSITLTDEQKTAIKNWLGL